jgi:hypothetical protein
MSSLMSFLMDFVKARDIITMYLVMIITLVLVCHMISLDLVSSSSSSFQNSRLVHIHKECWITLVSIEYLATQQFSLGYPMYMKSTVSNHIAQRLTCMVMTYEDLCSFYHCFDVCGIMTILILFCENLNYYLLLSFIVLLFGSGSQYHFLGSESLMFKEKLVG